MHGKRRNRPVLGSLEVLKLCSVPGSSRWMWSTRASPWRRPLVWFFRSGDMGLDVGLTTEFLVPWSLERVGRTLDHLDKHPFCFGFRWWWLAYGGSLSLGPIADGRFSKPNFSTGSTITESPWDLQIDLCVRKGSRPSVKVGNVWVFSFFGISLS